MARSRMIRKRMDIGILLGLIAVVLTLLVTNARGQLLYWVEDGAVRSYCVESGASDVVQLPGDLAYVRELAVSEAGMALATAKDNWAQPLTIHGGDMFGQNLSTIAVSPRGGASLTSSIDVASDNLDSLLFWDSGLYRHRIDMLVADRGTKLPVQLTPFPYEIPDDSGLKVPTQTLDLFATWDALYRLVRDQQGDWLQVTTYPTGGSSTELYPLDAPTWKIQADEDNLYTVEGDLESPSVVRYHRYWAPDGTREVLLESSDFGPDGRIVGIALEQSPLEYADLFVLHAGMISRIPRDGGPAEIVHEFAEPASESRHDLQAVYMRPTECDRLFGDDDGDGVANAYDDCVETPPGAAVDHAGRPLGDLNNDCAVDLRDFAVLQIGMALAGR